MDLSIRVIAFNTFCDRSRFASRHPHLSVVQVFKDRFCCAVSFDSSAAERRDYEELSTTRQALLAKFLTTLAPPHTAENPRRCSEVRIIYTPNPPSIPFCKIVGMDPKRVQMLRYPYSLYCRQGDIDHATDHQKLVFALKDAGKQTAVKENLGQWHVDRKNVVAELAGALPAAGK